MWFINIDSWWHYYIFKYISDLFLIFYTIYNKSAISDQISEYFIFIVKYLSCSLLKTAVRILLRDSAFSQSTLTSLKRFQCLILRLYCEMVDSHCSSSMKFPAFSASLPPFASACRLDLASITSGTRRHTMSEVFSMLAGSKRLALRLSGGGPPPGSSGCWDWAETTTWLAYRMLLLRGVGDWGRLDGSWSTTDTGTLVLIQVHIMICGSR